MSMSTGFLSGARDRLLPASIPFRFFLSAALFQILAWVALLAGAEEVPGFSGGAGPVLAAIHLITLGVLAMTAMGASYQLLPVATRRPLARTWPAALSFWLYLPGVILLSWGMASSDPRAMLAGLGPVLAGLALFALLMADNLRRAGSVAVVAGHGWGALAMLVAAATLGGTLLLSLASGYDAGADQGALAALHMVVAAYGFMGLLVLGLSLILVPMFVLSRSLPPGPGWAQLGLALAALAALAAGFWADLPLLSWGGLVLAAAAAGTHLWLMQRALSMSMRRRLGLPFVQIRAGWALLVLSLALGALLMAGAPVPNLPALFGFTLVAGWLLTFLGGVLQRIMPFLASMHAAGKSGLPPLLSELTAEWALKLYMPGHFAALALTAAGILLDSPGLIRLGAVAGMIGATAFAVFAGRIAWHLFSRIGRS